MRLRRAASAFSLRRARARLIELVIRKPMVQPKAAQINTADPLSMTRD